TSVSYLEDNVSNLFSTWETKLYFNNITHTMDDTHRPDVAMHMDMPGKSRTGGYYTTLKGRTGRHRIVLSQDSYYNQSWADMTMYPKDGSKEPMFMYTWPDVRTLNVSVYVEDRYMIDSKDALQVSSKISFQRDGEQSNFGYESMKIYYPDMAQFQNRLLWNVSAKYTHYWQDVQLKLGGSYGDRAPSVTEAYGFYLYNSFDNYDNIGNPHLRNESSAEVNGAFVLNKPTYSVTLDASYFYFFNYIIGKQESYAPMTIGASGVKVYRNLNHAQIFNAGLEAKVLFLNNFHWVNHLTYSRGTDDIENPLPLIAPFGYTSAIEFFRKRFSAEAEVQGAAPRDCYRPDYGESRTPGYALLNLSAGYDFPVAHHTLSVKTGVENLFDRQYSTYADWNHILRKGRNVFINLKLTI
ncbi:MAG: TonB-dependent receptor, partial [Bacteroidota bacterium]|nr:TonB-dependent receptor [Bacteroidota bacterium]